MRAFAHTWAGERRPGNLPTCRRAGQVPRNCEGRCEGFFFKNRLDNRRVAQDTPPKLRTRQVHAHVLFPSCSRITTLASAQQKDMRGFASQPDITLGAFHIQVRDLTWMVLATRGPRSTVQSMSSKQRGRLNHANESGPRQSMINSGIGWYARQNARTASNVQRADGLVGRYFTSGWPSGILIGLLYH